MIKLLIFHPTIAPYRVDFFNDLYKAFTTRICLQYWNLRDQTFDYGKIYSQFIFKPYYLRELFNISNRSISVGYWKHLDEFNPDVVLVNEFSITTIIVLLHRFFKRKRYKIVSLCDDSYNMVAENNDFSKIHRFMRKIILPKLDGIILVEPKVTEWYKKHYNKGFCFPIIKPDDKTRAVYQRALHISSSLMNDYNLSKKKVILFVGRLVALKNVDTIIESFAKLNQQEHILVIIGDGPEKNKLVQLAYDKGVNVIFTGRLEGESLYAWYNVASIFILASYQEAFGAVTNEALLAGCYTLVSKNAGSSCLVEDEVNGYTIEPFDIKDITNKMNKISNRVMPINKVTLKKNLMQESYYDKMKELITYIKMLYEK